MNTYLLGKNNFDFTISYYCGTGYPMDALKLHAHPYHEFSLISDGDITYTSQTCMEHVTGPALSSPEPTSSTIRLSPNPTNTPVTSLSSRRECLPASRRKYNRS